MSRLRDGQLWIGGLKEYMDEDFIKTALRIMGEAPPLSVKVITEGQTNPSFSNFYRTRVRSLAMLVSN